MRVAQQFALMQHPAGSRLNLREQRFAAIHDECAQATRWRAGRLRFPQRLAGRARHGQQRTGQTGARCFVGRRTCGADWCVQPIVGVQGFEQEVERGPLRNLIEDKQIRRIRVSATATYAQKMNNGHCCHKRSQIVPQFL